MIDKRKKLPVVALRGAVLLPDMVTHFEVARLKSKYAMEKAMTEDRCVFFVMQKDSNVAEPMKEDLYEYGCVGVIKQIVKMPKDISKILVMGTKRARIFKMSEEDSYLEAEIDIIEDIVDDEFFESEDGEGEEEMFAKSLSISRNREAKLRELKDVFETYLKTVPHKKIDFKQAVTPIEELEKLVNMIGWNCGLDSKHTQELLETIHLEDRYEMLLTKITDEIEIHFIREEIHAKVKGNIDKSQKEFVLREHMKVIREELGEDLFQSDIEELQEAVELLDANDKVKEKLSKEIKRLKGVQQSSPESGVIRTYIETMLEMPWNKIGKESCSIVSAKKVLNKDHYGLEEVKERILEYLAVRSFVKKGSSTILCLVGPPGTGKTSIARSLANAMDKKYVRISLGGVHDEAEIRGHRKTYVGAMPGRIAVGMKQAGVKNPLMLLDEIDKVSVDHRGDTFSALLEVLDSEQNMKFRDHYLEVPIDLSEVLFVATANSLQTIPRPLLDRMEIIEINSYTENEKVHIGKKHLVPKQLETHGLSAKELSISPAALEKIARNYTKEAGVRQFERKIAEICRKVAKEIVETKKNKIRVTESNLEKYLGYEKFHYQSRNEKDEIGIVRGLAWTSVGGDTLQIEVNVMPGKGELSLTGQLGDVMKESASAGMSYIRSVASEYHIADEYFNKTDIHVHIPEGAVPKDGPSAGITMATAILSAITKKPVRADVAMTGEITLRGRVLPIGGLKEKLLAAKNAGIKTVVVPVDNQRDVEKIASEITQALEIIPVKHMSEVCEIAFVKE